MEVRARLVGRRGHVDASADGTATATGQSSALITVSDALGTRPDGRITTVWAQVSELYSRKFTAPAVGCSRSSYCINYAPPISQSGRPAVRNLMEYFLKAQISKKSRDARRQLTPKQECFSVAV